MVRAEKSASFVSFYELAKCERRLECKDLIPTKTEPPSRAMTSSFVAEKTTYSEIWNGVSD